MKGPVLTGLSALIFALPALAAAPATYTVGASTRDGSYAATATVEAVRQGKNQGRQSSQHGAFHCISSWPCLLYRYIAIDATSNRK